MLKRHIELPAASVVASGKRRDFCRKLATYGGGHVPVPSIFQETTHRLHVTSVVAPTKRRGFCWELATYGGGHIRVPISVFDWLSSRIQRFNSSSSRREH